MASTCTASWYDRDTNDSSKAFAKAASHSSYATNNSITWSFWISCARGVNKNIFSRWESAASNNRSWLFSTQSDGTFRTIFSWDGSSFSLHKSNSSIFDYSWLHIMVSFVNGVQTVYFNNVLQTMNQTIAWGGGAAGLFNSNAQVMLGSIDPSSPPIDGSTGGCKTHFSIWNIVLNSSQRTELYNNGVPGNIAVHSAVANCTNWWRVDQTDSGTTLVDSIAGSGANMTITTSGSSGIFQKTTQHPQYSVALSDTKTGVQGEDGTGTYDGSDRWTDPSDTNVKTGTSYKANSLTNNKTGTYDGSDRWTDPGESNVRVATAYKANSLTNNKTGLLDLPVIANVLTGISYDNSTKTGTLVIPTVADHWNALTSGFSTSGSVGKLIKDYLDAAITSRLASGSYIAPDNTTISAINLKTTNLPSDPASNTYVLEKTDAIVDTIEEPYLVPTLAAVQDIQDKIGTPANGTISDDIAAIDIEVGDVPTVTNIVNGVWDAQRSDHTVSGSFGVFFKKILTIGKFEGTK